MKCVISDRSRCGCSLSQMLAGVLLPWWAGALCPVSAWHFPREGGAASLRPLPRQWRPRPCRSTKHLLLCRYFNVPGINNVKHVFLILWSVLIPPSLLCSTKSRPVSNGVLLQRRVQTLSAVPSGRLPTRFGTDTVLPLWGRTGHQAGRCQLLPWLWSQRSVCALFYATKEGKSTEIICKIVSLFLPCSSVFSRSLLQHHSTPVYPLPSGDVSDRV